MFVIFILFGVLYCKRTRKGYKIIDLVNPHRAKVLNIRFHRPFGDYEEVLRTLLGRSSLLQELEHWVVVFVSRGLILPCDCSDQETWPTRSLESLKMSPRCVCPIGI